MTEDWNLFQNGPTSAHDVADVAADELAKALEAHGIRHTGSDGDGDDATVTVGLASIRDAETLLSLVFEGPAGPGTMYDRATSSCVTLTQLDDDLDDDTMSKLVGDAFENGWTWMIHPTMSGRVVGWHTSVTIPFADVFLVTARLNELRNGRTV